LGFDNGTRTLPESIPLKADFVVLNNGAKTAYGKDFTNIWSTQKNSSNILPVLNQSFLINGGFNTKLEGNNKLAAIFVYYLYANEE